MLGFVWAVNEATVVDASKCPVCGGNDHRVCVRRGDGAMVHAAIGSSRTEVSPGIVLRCRSCGHGFRRGSFSDAELGELYASMDTSRYESEGPCRLKTARRHMSLVQSSNGPQGGRLLDVGCASGVFLESAAQSGWQVSGIEPNRNLAHAAMGRLKSAHIENSTLAEAQLPPGSFDVVSAWDVLEHVPDPTAFLRQCAGFLKPKGVLWIKVPDIGSPQARVMGDKWPIYLPEHLGYFSRRSLTLCAENAGLRIVRLTRSPVTFSAGYIFYRAAQHSVPFARVMRRLIDGAGLANFPISLYLGEMYACMRMNRGRMASPIACEEPV